jgi:hypothetical protein
MHARYEVNRHSSHLRPFETVEQRHKKQVPAAQSFDKSFGSRNIKAEATLHGTDIETKTGRARVRRRDDSI